jgi:hypothetical protein
MAKHMTDSSSAPSHEQISQRAYEIFIERGRPEGQDLAHWLEAERQLRAAGKQQAATQQPVHAAAAGGAEAAIAASRTTPPGNGRGRTTARAGARK